MTKVKELNPSAAEAEDVQGEEVKEKQAKPSYEQLEKFAIQQAEELRRLRDGMMRMDRTNTFKFLDYAFEVLRCKEHFDDAFVKRMADVIQDALTEKKEEEKPDDSEKLLEAE